MRVKSNDYYRFRLQMLQKLMQEYAGDSKALIELGCGWGLNLFSLRLADRWERLVGFDISEHAITAAREAACHFKLDDMTFGTLDLTDKDDSSFTTLNGQVVFTYHCLEQLKYSTVQVIENLIRAKVRRVIHFEPTVELLSPWSLMDWVNRLYIARQDYGDNLLKTLWDLEKNGRLRILETKRLYFAPTHRHDNVLVCWEPHTGA